jgi:hypothetical protein
MRNLWITILGLLMAVGLVVALGAGWALMNQRDADGTEAHASASGEMLAIQGTDPFALDRAAPTSGRIDVRAVDQGGRWSPLQSPDTMNLEAEFTHPADGSTYRVVINTPMRQEPEGRYTTWFGVALGQAHHGDTRIDTPALPRVAAELSVWGLADVFKDGQQIGSQVPAHMMVVKKDQGSLPGQVFLSVGTERKNVLGAPDGYLNVIWREVQQLSTPATQGIDLTARRESAGGLQPANFDELFQFGRRELLGYGALLFVVAASLLLALRPWPLRGAAARARRV